MPKKKKGNIVLAYIYIFTFLNFFITFFFSDHQFRLFFSFLSSVLNRAQFTKLEKF